MALVNTYNLNFRFILKRYSIGGAKLKMGRVLAQLLLAHSAATNYVLKRTVKF